MRLWALLRLCTIESAKFRSYKIGQQCPPDEENMEPLKEWQVIECAFAKVVDTLNDLAYAYDIFSIYWYLSEDDLYAVIVAKLRH